VVQIIARHFYQTGKLSVASTFEDEAHIGADALQRPFKEMHTILQEVNPFEMHLIVQTVSQLGGPK
jgi:hypothetical protein